MQTRDSGFIKKELCELVHISLYLAQPKRFYTLFDLTCPNLAPTFYNRLGRPKRAPANALRCFGLTGLAFFYVYMHAARELFRDFLGLYLYVKYFDRLAQ